MLEDDPLKYNAEVDCIAIPGNFAYYGIPTSSLRASVDSLFPALAKCPQADCLSGAFHRFRGGHDLIIDVAKTMRVDGFAPAMHQVGHIALTDFPTKAGIPIPGFSGTGLGKHLAELGINKGWMCVNLCDTMVGVLAVAEASSDLFQAISGQLEMNTWTFFDTFVEGGIEIAIAYSTKNAPLLAAGVENVIAGVVATGNSLTKYLEPFYIDPLNFLGHAFCAGIIGFSISALILKKDLDVSLINAMKSGAVSALFVLSPAFAYGAMAAFALIGFGEYLAKKNTESVDSCLYWDQAAVCAYMMSSEALFPGFKEWYERGAFKFRHDVKEIVLAERPFSLPSKISSLFSERRLLHSSCLVLKGRCSFLDSGEDRLCCRSVPVCFKNHPAA